MKKNNMLTADQMNLVSQMVFQKPTCGVYGINVKALFPELEGEEDEWNVTTAHDGEGREGIAISHLVYDEDYNDWWPDETIFFWFPSNWCYGRRDESHLVYEIINDAPFSGDIKILQRECLKAGGISNLNLSMKGCEEFHWEEITTPDKCGVGVYNKGKQYCLRFWFPEGLWRWERGIPYYKETTGRW